MTSIVIIINVPAAGPRAPAATPLEGGCRPTEKPDTATRIVQETPLSSNIKL